jgi:imidazolonepropionase-like amidohydrolase
MSPLHLALILAAGWGAGEATGPELCLVGGEVIDPERQVSERADVVVAGARILRVGPDAARVCRGRRLDVRGRWLLPGLIDLHVHAWGNPSPSGGPDEEPGHEAVARLVLRAGVTAMLDLAGDDDRRLALRERTRTSPDHARYLVGLAVGSGGDPERLRARVREAARRKPDVLKVFPWGGKISVVLEEARRLGLRTVVHIDSWANARLAVAAGASVITHFEDEAVIPDDLVAAMARGGVASMPTLAVQCALARIAGAGPAGRPLARHRHRPGAADGLPSSGAL